MDYKSHYCIECTFIGFEHGTGEPFCTKEGRECKDDFQQACEGFELYRDCDRCRHQEVLKDTLTGLTVKSCRKWDCNFEPKEGD